MNAGSGVAQGSRPYLACLELSGILQNMLQLSGDPIRARDIDREHIEQCGSVRSASWGGDICLITLVARTTAGMRFELRGYQEPELGLVTEAAFRYLS